MACFGVHANGRYFYFLCIIVQTCWPCKRRNIGHFIACINWTHIICSFSPVFGYLRKLDFLFDTTIVCHYLIIPATSYFEEIVDINLFSINTYGTHTHRFSGSSKHKKKPNFCLICLQKFIMQWCNIWQEESSGGQATGKGETVCREKVHRFHVPYGKWAGTKIP